MAVSWSERTAAEQLHELAAEFERLGEPDLARANLELAAALAPDTDLSSTPAFEPIRLRHLAVGSDAWCVPWALARALDKRHYLSVDTEAYPRPGIEPHTTMRVERCEDGWHVWPGRAQYVIKDWNVTGMAETFERVARLHH